MVETPPLAGAPSGVSGGPAGKSPRKTPMANPENLKPPWQPGQSGNPNGRPRKESSVRAAIAELLSEPEGDRDRLRALLESLYHRATKRGDTTAARLLLEYGFGRPDSLPADEGFRS